MSGAEKGKQIIFVTVVWLFLKELVNSVITMINGGSFGEILPGLAVAALFGAVLIHAPSWIRYVVGLILIIQTLRFLVPNISDIIGWGAIYLIEGIFDVILAIVLFTNADVKTFYDEKNS